MYLSSWGIITKYHGHFDLTGLEAGKSKIKVLGDLVSGKNALLGLQTASNLLGPHMVE